MKTINPFVINYYNYDHKNITNNNRITHIPMLTKCITKMSAVTNTSLALAFVKYEDEHHGVVLITFIYRGMAR